MRPFFAVMVWVVVAMGVVSLGAAFGGQDRLSEAEYFAEFESLMAELRAGEEDLAQRNPAPANDAPLDAMVANLSRTYEAYDGLRTYFAARLDELRPPVELRLTHRTLLLNAEQIAEGQLEAVRQLGEVRILVDVQAAFRHLYGPTQLFTEACKELQALAGLDLELRCDP